MPLIITQGLGRNGDGTSSALLTTAGYGSAGVPVFPVCKAFIAFGINPGMEYLDIVLSNIPTITGPAAAPASYVITPLNGGAPATVLSVTIVANRLHLVTTEHQLGKNYRIVVPEIGLVDIYSNPYDGPFTLDYVGQGEAPQALIARSIDARTFEITFNEPVNEAEALNPANYSISPTLATNAVVKLTDTSYRITTAHQVRNQLYTVTVFGIHDTEGNLI